MASVTPETTPARNDDPARKRDYVPVENLREGKVYLIPLVTSNVPEPREYVPVRYLGRASLEEAAEIDTVQPGDFKVEYLTEVRRRPSKEEKPSEVIGRGTRVAVWRGFVAFRQPPADYKVPERPIDVIAS